MTLQELGEALRSAREKRELSIEDVAAYLKLSTNQITAIEEGNIAAFPHIVYAKGFIKSYASMMNIAQEEVAQAMTPYTSQGQLVDSAYGHKTESAEQSTASGPGIGTLSAVLLAILAGLIFWFRQPLMDKWQEISQSGSTSSDTIAQVQNAPESSPVASAPATLPGQSSMAAQPAAPQSPAQETAPATAAAPSQEQAPAPNESEAPAAAEKQQQDKHELVIIANKICWLNARPSNLPPKGRVLQRGERLAIPFEKRITLKLGNASAVSVFYDGEEWQLGPQKARVKVLTFPPEN